MSPRGMALGGLALVVAGAAGATYLLSHSQGAAELVGIASEESSQATSPVQPLASPQEQGAVAAAASANDAAVEARVAVEEIDSLEDRMARIETRIRKAEGSAGRADGLLIAFAARRAIERGVALGYLEPLLVDRFGERYQREVAQVVTASRSPVMIEDLVRRYEELGPVLRRGAEDPGFWQNFKREVGSLVIVYSADQPNPRPKARYDRALVELRLGDVSAALSETMRLPGAESAQDWVADARRYVAVRGALDRLESAALLSREENATNRVVDR